MATKEEASTRVRKIIQNVAIYSAGAWAFVEAAGFLFDRYSLADERLLDAIVFAAVLGACAVCVISWFHGTPGRQPSPTVEKVLVAMLGVAALAGATIIATADPYAEFLSVDGFRVTVVFPNKTGDGDGDSPYKLNMNVSDEEARALLMARVEHPDKPTFVMNPDNFELIIPGAIFQGKGTPTSVLAVRGNEYARVTTILPDRPAQVDSLAAMGAEHTSAYIEYGAMSLRIDRPFELNVMETEVEFKIVGPFYIEDEEATE